jgi:hypothetical protein
MEITNGEIKADLPDTLAKLLIDNLDWTKDRTGGKAARETVTLADRVNALAAQPAEAEAPIPMTRVPGVIDKLRLREDKAYRECQTCLKARRARGAARN